MQTEQMMDEKFTSVVSEEEQEGEGEDDGSKNEPPEKFLSALEAIDTVRKTSLNLISLIT
jgi:hypothetical protein